ncbi:MAG TPA: amidohydrolase family protein [Bryobacteraceae bacterium]|jgi:predicted TIM-barrel fold metal-dependent hydrolase|nr:amidohydrolase family protein [Bryobacteraceae bacterium]
MIARPSPWGTPIAIADAHVHFFSHRFFETLASQKPGLLFESLHWQMPPERAEDLANIWAHELDRQGVAHAALIASVPGDEESVMKAIAAFPERFFAYAMVNPANWQPSDVAAACLFPAMHRYSIHSDAALRVFDWARENRRAVFVHCGVLSVGVRKKLGLESLYDMRFSNPIDLHAVAMRYPTVPIIVPHFGAGYFREALMLLDLCPNVYLDTSSSNQWMKYQESHLDLRQVFRRALDVAGPRRLLFGTDSSFFPRGWHHQIFEDQARVLYELNVSEEDARLIFSENLLRILAG